MELNDNARRVLSQLATAKGDANLFGKRDGGTPLSLVDSAAIAENRLRVDSMQLIDRATVDQLVLAGYLEDFTGVSDSVNIAFRISAKGRSLFPNSN